MKIDTEGQTRLDDIANKILSKDGSLGEQAPALCSYAGLCGSLSLPDFGAKQFSEYTDEGGRIISPVSAIECVTDYVRTVEFLNGIYKGILELKRRFPGEKLHIMYGGCGPYATLLYPLLRRFSKDELEIELVDYYAICVDNAVHISRQLGFNGYIKSVENGDVRTYEPKGRPHMIILEAMDKALLNEHQVAGEYNLRRFLREDGLFVPDVVDLSATVVDDLGSAVLGKLFSLQGDVRERVGAVMEGFLISGRFELPDNLEGEGKVVIKTEVTIFDDVKLSPGTSCITCDTTCGFFDSKDAVGHDLEISYKPGEAQNDISLNLVPGNPAKVLVESDYA